MSMRILFFEDEPAIRRPISAFLRANGFEVLDFSSPMACTLVAGEKCSCPRDKACADLVITDMKMPGMTGLDLLRRMIAKGCRTSTQHKIVISSGLTPGQAEEFRALGCHYLPKPFALEDLLGLVQRCARDLPPDRQLVPVDDLWKPDGDPV